MTVMATDMTARVPTTPETHTRLKQERDRLGADTFDETLRQLLDASDGVTPKDES